MVVDLDRPKEAPSWTYYISGVLATLEKEVWQEYAFVSVRAKNDKENAAQVFGANSKET